MLKRATLVAVAVLASGCGSNTQQDTSTGGIWAGDIENGNGGLFPADQLTGVIGEHGDGYLLDSGNFTNPTPALYRLASQAQQGGQQIAGSYTVFSLNGQAFRNGKLIDTGTLTGALYPQNFISGTAVLADDDTNPAPTPQGVVLSFDKLYFTPFSFAAIAGSYNASVTATTGADSGTLMLKTDGSFSMVNGAGCTLSGTLGIPDARYNAYGLTGTYACSGSSTVTLTGWAYYIPANPTAVTPTPAILNIEYDDSKTTAGYISASLPPPPTP